MKTKIICTLGPASESESVIRRMAQAGMSVARFNFSHGSHAEHLKRMKTLRAVNKKYGFRVKILQDLEGYRIRIGSLKGHKPVIVSKGEKVFLAREGASGRGKIIPFDYDGSFDDFRGLDFIYIDDGYISLKIIKVLSDRVLAEVAVGGAVNEHKGVNIPGLRIRFEGLTDKDRKDAAFGIEQKVDFIAQSFVRNAKDMLIVREAVEKALPSCRFIAKIENDEGIKNIDSIIGACDGIMVARGDMGVSLPVYEVPIFQKMIIDKCNRRKKIDITATQMLESMTENIRPTRAEVSDIANAVLDGADYVMLSGETAKGKYPVETVEMMRAVIEYTEKSALYKKKNHKR